MAREPKKILIGLVDAMGAGGFSGGRGGWKLVFTLAGWRTPGSPVEVGERRCDMPMQEEELDVMMGRIGPYTILEAEIQGRPTAHATKLARVVRTGVADAELAELAERLRRPILLEDPALGRLEYSRKFGAYQGRVDWLGKAVELSLECDPPEDAADVLKAARRLYRSRKKWDRLVREFAIRELLPLKNESWLDEGEPECSRDEFLARMNLEGITIDESGEFSFWHNDGGLFLGHTIQISGNLDEGPTEADIPG